MHFDDFCSSVECPCFKEWEYTLTVSDHGRDYESTIECAACTKNPESECIDVYPDDCLHLESIKEHEAINIRARELFEKEWEQEKIWKKLAHV